MARSSPPRLVAWSARVYESLLRLFPAPFRRLYGAQIVQVFRDLCGETYARAGRAGVARLWVASVWDLGVSALGEHLAQPAAPLVVRRGLGFGAVLGVAWAVLLMLLDLRAPARPLGDLLLGAFGTLLIALCLLAGRAGARRTGRAGTGLWTGLVTALVAALIGDLAVLAIVTVFLDVLRGNPAEIHAWLQSGAPDFAAYELDDALGGCLYTTVLGAALGAGLGALGGLIGQRGPRLPTAR